MDVFNPFSLKILSLFAASLTGSYLLGSLFYKSSNKLDNLSMRLALGHVAGLVAVAVTFSGTSTMTVIMLPVFAYLLIKRFHPASDAAGDTSETTSYFEYLPLALMSLGFLMLDALRIDIREGDAFLYIGNTDISYYGSTGRMMFEFGEETLPSSMRETPEKMVYHFGDMWLSGVYSYFFDVIPYYAYGVLYRSVCSSILFVLMFSFFRKIGGFAEAIGFSALGMVVNSALLWAFPNFGLDLLSPFFNSWPIYAESSFLIVGIASFVFLKLIEVGRVTEGVAAFLLAACLHSVFIVPSFIFAFIILFLKIAFPRILKKSMLPTEWFSVGLIVLAGILPYVFVVVDGRSLSMPVTLNVGMLYLVLHTAIRTSLTLVLLGPFLVGLMFLFKSKKYRAISSVVAFYCLAGIIGFSVLFAVFQSPNTTKLLTGLMSALLFPFGLLGLAKLMGSKTVRNQVVGVILIGLIVCSTIVGGISTSCFRSVYSWSYIQGYKEKWTLSKNEVVTLREKLAQGIYAGYAVCDEDVFKGDLIRYNSFIGINGLLNGGHIFRLNAIENDTASTVETRSWALKSVPVIISQKQKDRRLATKQYIQLLGIEYLIQDRSLAGLCKPEEIGFQIVERMETDRYDLHRIVMQ